MKDNEILKETLLHYINLEYYANGIDEEFQTLLEELETRCSAAILSQNSLNTKLSYNTIMKVIKDEVTEYQKLLEERLDEELELVLNDELEFLDETYNKRGGINGALLALGGITASRLLFAPIVGNDTTKQFVERTGKNILHSYETPLRSGYLFGKNTEEINNQVSKNLKQVARGMQNGIRTAIPSAAKTTDRAVFLNNDVEVIWVATLDGRTCISCSSLSGLHFKSISEAPSNPHVLCRCLLLPASSVKEPVPEFEEFINELDEEDQKSVLGDNRFSLWKEYGVNLRNFINNGEVKPVEELNLEFANYKANKNLIIPETKLAGYALNPNHPVGKNKAVVFQSALGYTLDNWKDLEENIRKRVVQKNMVFELENQYGKKYNYDIEITGPNGKTAIVRTGWIVTSDGRVTLTTVFVR